MNIGAKPGLFVKGLAVGALVGTALGVLVAPRPGKQTRNLVRRKTGGYAGSLRERFRRNGAVNHTADRAESHTTVSG